MNHKEIIEKLEKAKVETEQLLENVNNALDRQKVAKYIEETGFSPGVRELLEPVAQPEPKKKCRKCADGGSYIDKEGTFKWCECEVGKTITNGLYLGLLKCSLNR